MSLFGKLQDLMPIKRRKDSGAWEVTLPRPGRPPLRRSSASWARADAAAFEQRMLASGHTLDEALDKWLAEYVPFLRHPKKYESKANLLRPYLAGMSLEQAPEVAAQIRREMAGKAPATINRILAVLRRICHLAYKDWDWIDKPIGSKIRMLQELNERHYYLTRAEVERLRMLCTIPEVGNLLVVAAFTGLRKSELLSLSRSNIINGELHLRGRTKSGRPRVIPLHPRAAKIIEQLPYKNVTPAILRKQFEQAREEAGMEHINWHDLRHTFASWLIQSGAPLQVIKELLGHATIQMTLRYAHLSTANLRSAIESL